MNFDEVKQIKKNGFIDLTNLDSILESKELISGSKPKKWYKFNNQKVLFKESNDTLSYLGEIIYSKIAKKINLNNSDCHLAILNQQKGILSPDFVKDNIFITGEELIEMSVNIKAENHRSFVSYIIEKFQYNNLIDINNFIKKEFNNIITSEKINQQLLKMFTLDLLLAQEDRHPENWGLLIDYDDINLIVYDNEASLGLYTEKSAFKEYCEDINDFQDSLLTEQNIKYSFTLFRKSEKIHPIDQLIKFYKNTNEENKKTIDEVLDNFNLKEVLKEIEKEIKIEKPVKTIIEKTANERYEKIIRNLKKKNQSKAIIRSR